MTTTLTYAAFLLLFVVAPIFGLSVASWRRGLPLPREGLVPTVLMVVVALAYTTPWDNYLIGQGVWWYGQGAVVLTIGLAPLEEYLFMAFQPVLAALWFYTLRWPPVHPEEPLPRRARLVGTVGWLVLAALGAAALTVPSTYYLGAILAWAAPVLALQWAVGGHYLWAARRDLAPVVAFPVAYLWAVDWYAIRLGIWTISPDHTTGLGLFGLPVEEMLFFLVTTLLVVQGIVLYHWVVDRWL
ncbi:lycopene cyclase domain-containing protein [Haloarchaeobius amylolyticus]|uniref:lycopene cyclase domain-containing protein n=1 Tax=Haloarchaeobius amylolyticus TaxID=1198296 RepID=UPI002270AFBB|nr:lycopene cyclase domain-containing protein [Haloarchaeobius amylolyticus]